MSSWFRMRVRLLLSLSLRRHDRPLSSRSWCLVVFLISEGLYYRFALVFVKFSVIKILSASFLRFSFELYTFSWYLNDNNLAITRFFVSTFTNNISLDLMYFEWYYLYRQRVHQCYAIEDWSSWNIVPGVQDGLLNYWQCHVKSLFPCLLSFNADFKCCSSEYVRLQGVPAQKSFLSVRRFFFVVVWFFSCLF